MATEQNQIRDRRPMSDALRECPLTLVYEDKAYKYRWVTETQVETRKGQGYVLVKNGENKKELPVAQTHVEDSSNIRYQTLFLMKTPIENWKKRRQDVRAKSDRQLQAIEQNFKEEAHRAKVSVVKEKNIE